MTQSARTKRSPVRAGQMLDRSSAGSLRGDSPILLHSLLSRLPGGTNLMLRRDPIMAYRGASKVRSVTSDGEASWLDIYRRAIGVEEIDAAAGDSCKFTSTARDRRPAHAKMQL